MTTPRTRSTVQGAVALLELFDADHTQWTLSDLARHLSQPVSTVHEHLTTLSASGLLTKLGRGRYGLGWRLLKLSSALYGSLPWYAHAHAAMERVARRTHHLTFVSVLDGPRVLCIARSVQGRDPSPTSGETVKGETHFELPAHATAGGKLLLALAGHPLPPNAEAFTPRTITTPTAWNTEAAAIRHTNFAQAVDEWAPGTSALAVPIRTDTGVQGALGVSLPTTCLRARESLLRTLQDETDHVNWSLGSRT